MPTFWVAAAVAVVATVMVLTRSQPVHALLYLVVSFLAVAVVLYTLGAPFVAALEVVVYAGAIVVLFLFVVMLLSLDATAHRERTSWPTYLGATILAAVILVELGVLVSREPIVAQAGAIGPREVGLALYGPYVLGVEIASVLLLSGAVGAFHVGRRDEQDAAAFYAESDPRVPGGREEPVLEPVSVDDTLPAAERPARDGRHAAGEEAE